MRTINDYAELVKEKHALNETIAPVEADETDASKAYAVGEQLILSGILYDVIAPISEHDVITTTGSGANIAPAGPISSKIQTLTNKLDGEVATRARLGAHQLIPFDLAAMKARNTAGTWNGNSYTRDGITYTVELDNYGNVIGFDVDGTGHNAAFVICPSAQIARLLNLPLIMSCNTSPDLTFMAYRYDGTNNLYCHGDDVDVTLTSNVVQFQLYIRGSNDKTFSHFKIYPLLRNEDDTSREFTPYAMTNRELTEKLIIDDDVVISLSEGITIDYKHCYKIGNIVFLNFRFLFGPTATVATNAVIATVDKKPKTQILLPSFQTWDGSIGDMVQLNTNGTLVMPAIAKFAVNKNFFINACYITED